LVFIASACSLNALSFPGPSGFSSEINSKADSDKFTAKNYPIAERNRNLVIHIDSNSCKVTETQTFYNGGKRTLYFSLFTILPEGTIPENSSTELKLFPKEESLEQAIKYAKNRTFPYLLDTLNHNLFKTNTLELNPHSHKTIKLSYTLKPEKVGTEHLYKIPYGTRGIHVAPLKKTQVTINTSGGLASHIHSPSHKLSPPFPRNRWSQISLTSSDCIPEEDLVLIVSPERKDTILHPVVHKSKDEYFIRIHRWPEINPSKSSKTTGTKFKNSNKQRACLIVMDTSGSLYGKRLELEKSAIKKCISKLDESDWLNIIPFSLSPRSWHFEFHRATKENIKKAFEYIDNLQANGATNLGETIQQAGEIAKTAPAGTECRIFMIIDGIADVGIISPEQLLKLSDQLIPDNTEVNILAIGANVDNRLLATIARKQRGIYVTAGNDLDIEESLMQLFEQAISPFDKSLKTTVRQSGIPINTWSNSEFARRIALPLITACSVTQNKPERIEATLSSSKSGELKTEIKQLNLSQSSIYEPAIETSVKTIQLTPHIASFIESIAPSGRIPQDLSEAENALFRYILRIPSGSDEENRLGEFTRTSGKEIQEAHRLLEQIEKTGTFLPRDYNGYLFRRVGERTFYRSYDRIWKEQPVSSKKIDRIKIIYGSTDWENLLRTHHDLRPVLSLGDKVIFMEKDQGYAILDN
jgi:uncharacterized protein YegL